jgi:hypothetical protein
MTMDEKRDNADYVRHVHESTQQYTRDVLKENERLASIVTALHEEKTRLERAVNALEERVKHHAAAESTLLVQIAEMNATGQAFTQRYLEVEQLNSNLANLYVASYRMHGSLEREEVLATLQEILINLIGTEEFAVFEREGDDTNMRCATSFGVDAARVQSLRLGEGRLGMAIARGTPCVAATEPELTSAAHPITACVPLCVGERVVGAIVVYRLLAHKAALEDTDLELFSLLATHGATALYCSALHARREREARA